MKKNTITNIVKGGIALAVAFLAPWTIYSQEAATPSSQVTPAAPGVSPPKPRKAISRMIKIRPSQKRPLNLQARERNPYARRTENEKTASDRGTDSEESLIRAKLTSLSVTGSSRGPNNDLKVQLGDITLQQGRILPQLIEDQTINLQVTELTEETITLGWLDIETKELTGKTMLVPYDLTPTIEYQLSGQSRLAGKQGTASAEPKMGVIRFAKERKQNRSWIASKDDEKSGLLGEDRKPYR